MPLQARFTKIKQNMEELLSRTWGEPVSLGTAQAFDDGHGAHRMEVLGGSSGVPQSVVAKVYDITLPERRKAFLREATGWEFLHEVFSDPKPIAECYGSSSNDGFILLEDLYDWEKTSMLLRGDWSTRSELGIQPMPSSNRRIASQAMSEWWKALGRIHATTAGKRSVYETILTSLGEVPDQPTDESQIGQMKRRYRVMSEAIGITPHPGSEKDLVVAMNALLNPGPLEAFIHGDPGPSNALYKDKVCRIIDLEASRYGNALLDGSFIHMQFPTSWCAGQLPGSLVQDLEALYRRELIKGCPAADDDALFYRRIADISVVRAVRAWRPWTGTNLIEEDAEWGMATMRQRAIARIGNAVSRTEQLGYLEAIGSTFKTMLDELHAIWPEEVHSIPNFAAFENQ